MTDEARHPAAGSAGPLLDKPPWAPDWAPSVADQRSLRWLRWGLLVVLAAGLAACMARGADSPADPTVVTPSTTAGVAGVPTAADVPFPDGFGTLLATITTAQGDEIEVCLLLAESEQQRQRGLMEVADPALAGFDGMLFRYDEDVTAGYYMFQTVLPLTIAYLAADGSLVSTADMAPCADPVPFNCPGYPPAGPFRYALEVPQGRLPDVGMAPGSVLTDSGQPCSP